MDLGTAGSILSYALDIEVKAAEFYQRAIDGATNANMKTALEEIHQRHRKIARTLERMRKETVTEMILEPIHGLKGDDFVIEPQNMPTTTETSKKMEQTILEFLRVSGEKVSFLPQMKGMLEEIAEKILKNLGTLNNL